MEQLVELREPELACACSIPNVALNCPMDPLVCYMTEGFLRGLEEIGFEMRHIPPIFACEVKRSDYVMPERLWSEINRLSINQQAEVIYEMGESVNASRALHAISLGDKDNPFGLLKGREHLGLPLALTGKRHCNEILELIKPFLPRFALDKGAVPGKDGLATYGAVRQVLLQKQRAAFEYKRHAGYVDMVRYIQGLEKWHKHHPRELCELYRNENAAMDAMNQVACNFL